MKTSFPSVLTKDQSSGPKTRRFWPQGPGPRLGHDPAEEAPPGAAAPTHTARRRPLGDPRWPLRRSARDATATAAG
eukprot:15467961-Alexandrium_andersonii.AAC.1